MKPAPLPVPMKGKKIKMMTQPSLGQSSNKKRLKMPIKTTKNPVRIITPPPQQPQVSKDEEENDSKAEEMAENQDMDSQRLGKRKRSPTACGLTPSKSESFHTAKGIMLYGFIVKGILESLAEDEEDSTENDGSDSETKEIETPDNF
ncbi:hypothetical protein ARMSODRAFT_1026470 [Armillaria solidipes]|uniref:Uncharacterized protein n=1 Tax=Armillaria solidipes TaxID=1076256 RepID=A0A2H3BBK5_9AGAR|nr:hypothetical protein ARMSODRAFT_1026470 [Armillaria solidipes]